jgi:hypothetical protein
MKSAPATPYLLPPDGLISDHPWTTEDGREIPELLEHWDPHTDTLVSRIVEADVDKIRSACQLGGDGTFALTASWYSSRTRLADHAAPVEFGHLRGRVRASVSLLVPGSAAGGRLDLRTSLVLRSAGDRMSPIAPRREGATLWTDEVRVALEGGSARFPTTAVDFRELPRFPDSASWALEWDSEDLELPVLGGMRLLVNANHEDLMESLRSGSQDPRSPVVRSFVTLDVARTLVHGALNNERFVEDPESFEAGSIGRLLFELLTMCWPTVPVAALVRRLQDDPTRLDAELQAHLGVLA